MERIEPKITIVCDLDDVLWGLCEHWIYHYKMLMKGYDYLAYKSRDKDMDKSMVTSWDITSCLKPTDTDMFWNVLDCKDFWQDMTVDKATVEALKAINDHPNIDLIICTDTYYKSATPKLARFFECFSFIEPRQLVCMKEKWRLNADIVIDDKPETLEKFLLAPNPPMYIIKIKQPWNETTVCDYEYDKFDMSLAEFCIACANINKEIINELKQEGDYYERCCYN